MNLDWVWLRDNLAEIGSAFAQHVVLAVLPLVAALVLALPLGYLVFRAGKGANPILAVLGVIHAIPSLALFVALPLLLGTRILDPVNVAVALTIYSVALLVGSVVDGLRSVPAAVRHSAAALGYGRWGRLLKIELPLAMPSVFAGLRVATVSNIALVTVAVLVAGGGLGRLFLRGYTSTFYTPLIVGLVLTVALALLADLVIQLIQRGTLPWARRQRA